MPHPGLQLAGQSSPWSHLGTSDMQSLGHNNANDETLAIAATFWPLPRHFGYQYPRPGHFGYQYPRPRHFGYHYPRPRHFGYQYPRPRHFGYQYPRPGRPVPESCLIAPKGYGATTLQRLTYRPLREPLRSQCEADAEPKQSRCGADGEPMRRSRCGADVEPM